MAMRGFVRLWAAAGALALALTLSGCLAVAEPPPGTRAAVDDAAAAIRSFPGVAGVEATVNSRGGGYGAPAGEAVRWSAQFTVRTESANVNLSAVAVSVASAAWIDLVPATVLLRSPGAHGAADVQLSLSARPSGAASEVGLAADAAGALREVPGITTASVSSDGEPAVLTIESVTAWPDLVTTVRAVPGFGRGALASAELRVGTDDARQQSLLTFDATVPNAGLVGLLGQLSADPMIDAVSFDGMTGRDRPDTWRPTLDVRVADTSAVADVAGRLSGLADSLTQVDGIPRTSFRVAAPAGSATAQTGYLGLPLGSAEPDDTLTALTAMVPPAAAAARLESDRALVTALLDAAGDQAGIRGSATVDTTTCETGAGEQVQGSVVVPIFEIADSADDAFAAITTAWEVDGFARSDHAMGTDFFSAPDGRLQSLSIRGRADGISIMALAPCVHSQ